LHPVSPFPFSFYQNNLDGSSIIAQAYALSAREPKKDRTSFISAQVPEDVKPDQGGQEKNPHGPPPEAPECHRQEPNEVRKVSQNTDDHNLDRAREDVNGKSSDFPFPSMRLTKKELSEPIFFFC
jgi:hypothetical protein